MIQPNPYGYSFFGAMSMALENLPVSQENTTVGLAHQADIQHAITSFIRVQCFQSQEMMNFTRGITKEKPFKKLGLHLFQVCLFEFGLVTHEDRQGQMQTLRQKIYDSLKELSEFWEQQKDNYVKLVPLIYYAILKKMFTVSKKLINSDQKYKIFHLVFFELKGKLVSDKYLQELVSKHLNDNYSRFIKEYSENITPLKSKPDRSLKRSEVKEPESRFKKSGKQNLTATPNYQTNKLILSKMAGQRRDHIEPLRREGFLGTHKR